MSYVISSPWTDAAEYGRGLGDRLAEALIQLPAIRAKMALSLQEHREQLQKDTFDREMKEKEFGLREKEVAATEGLRKATIEGTEAYHKGELDIRKQALQDKEQDQRKAFQFQQREQNLKNNNQRLQGREQQIREAAKRQHFRDTQAKPKKAEVQQQIIQGAQTVFQKTKNAGLARKYIQQNAQANGLTIDPFAVDFQGVQP